MPDTTYEVDESNVLRAIRSHLGFVVALLVVSRLNAGGESAFESPSSFLVGRGGVASPGSNVLGAHEHAKGGESSTYPIV